MNQKMTWVRKAIQYKNQIVFTAGLFLPAFVIFVYPDWSQPDDLDAFLKWSQVWAQGWQNIYVNCIDCNYPFLGMVFSAGAADWLGIRDFDGMIGLFRYYLAFIDLLNVVLLYFLLKALGVRDSAFWAGVVGLLPSSWMGASYWGQVDNAGQFFILGILLLTAKINALPPSKPYRVYLLAVAIGLLLSCLVMTKQLVLFSMISLGSMAVANIILISRKWTDALFALLAFLAAFAAPVLLVDSQVQYAPQYLSHLHYILATGSRHGDTISSYGFNVWSFFAADPFGSSHTALSVFGLNLIPYDAGISIFLIIVLALTGAAVFFYAGEIRRGGREFNASRLCFWLLHLALINLGFNLFLAGTHERYLYHFYPFVIASFLALPFTSGRSMTATLAGAIFYGGFLFGYLTGWNEYFGRLIFNGMGVFHAIFFVHLAWIFARYAKTFRAAGAPA